MAFRCAHCGRSQGCIGFQVSSNDGTDQLTLSANGIINVNVIPNTLSSVREGLYDIHATIWSDDFTVNRVYGRLPIYEGFSPVTTSTTGGTVGPKVKVWQLKIALVNAGVFDTVDTVVLQPRMTLQISSGLRAAIPRWGCVLPCRSRCAWLD